MPIVHDVVRCPRCGTRGARELNRLPEEGHAVLMCPFCKHTWCEDGRSRRGLDEQSMVIAVP